MSFVKGKTVLRIVQNGDAKRIQSDLPPYQAIQELIRMALHISKELGYMEAKNELEKDSKLVDKNGMKVVRSGKTT